ncbi:MAG TPA: hypothetical protein VMS56_00090, partial [Thermoanaerobaculia bacterium]|nr:hypothetical protein [Thermoanaerobaculia bacterium]
GKTTNLQFIYDSLPSNNKSKMLSLATKQDRTLFFDFLPIDLGRIRSMRTKLQLYTVPGQVYYNSTRQLVLKGADGIVFVADSQGSALDANLESWQNLEDNLKRQGVRIREIPVVLQYNKRDLPGALPVPKLDETLNRLGLPTFESVATTGIGVEESLRGISQAVLEHLISKYGLQGGEPLEKEIQPLNPPSKTEAAPEPSSIWTEDNVLASELGADGDAIPDAGDPPDYVVEDDAGDNLPTVPTELVASDSPFEDLIEPTHPARAAAKPSAAPSGPASKSAPASLPSIEIDLADIAVAPPGERRANDGFVRDITVPLNLSLAELQGRRRLRVRIQLDINILP